MKAIILDKRSSKQRTKPPFSNKKLLKPYARVLFYELFNNKKVEELSEDSISNSNYEDSYKDSMVLVNSTTVNNFSSTNLYKLLSAHNKKASVIKSKTK